MMDEIEDNVEKFNDFESGLWKSITERRRMKIEFAPRQRLSLAYMYEKYS